VIGKSDYKKNASSVIVNMRIQKNNNKIYTSMKRKRMRKVCATRSYPREAILCPRSRWKHRHHKSAKHGDACMQTDPWLCRMYSASWRAIGP
jgi:hypothetical protein